MAGLDDSNGSFRMSPEPERWETTSRDAPPNIEQILQNQGDSLEIRDKESSALRDITYDPEIK